MLSDLVAEQIRLWRKRRGWSRHRLAEECAQRGVELTPDSITNIEIRRKTGHRPRAITVDELIVIAHALHVPPAVLVCPYPEQPFVELLPGHPVPSYIALEWLCGMGIMDAGATPDVMDAYGEATIPLLYLRLNSYLQILLRAGQDEFANLREQQGRARGNAIIYLVQRLEALTCRLEILEEDLIRVRAYLTEHGYPLPDLHLNLRYLTDRTPDTSGPVELRYELPLTNEEMEETNT